MLPTIRVLHSTRANPHTMTTSFIHNHYFAQQDDGIKTQAQTLPQSIWTSEVGAERSRG